VWAGAPAKYVRNTTPAEAAALASAAADTALLAAMHAAETAKSGVQVANEAYVREDTWQRLDEEHPIPQVIIDFKHIYM
jgi:hypothetical protein